MRNDENPPRTNRNPEVMPTSLALDGALVRTRRALHDRSKEFAALAELHGKPRMDRWCRIATGAKMGHGW